jgi:pilus assembly protein CpaF
MVVASPRTLRSPEPLDVLDPIAPLMRDATLTEIMVNGPDAIYVERDGQLLLTDRQFEDENHLLQAIDVMLSGIGRPLDLSDPVLEARLPDGSRLTIVFPPVAVDGPMVTIRKFSARPIAIEDQIRFGSLSVEAASFLQACVLARANLLIAGGSSSGKTTLLNGLSASVPDNERIVTIEESVELRLQQGHVCRLESFPAGDKGKTVRELVRHAVRMRPDRLIIGEVRGGEALDMLQAMNTGHDGAMSTIHANGPRDALSRLETLVLMAGIDLPVRAIRQQIQAAINIVVHVSRQVDGSRKVISIAELTGIEDQAITLQEVFVSEAARSGAGARGWTRLVPTGIRPQMMDRIYQRGLAGPDLLRLFPPQHGGGLPSSGRRPSTIGEDPAMAPSHDRRQR